MRTPESLEKTLTQLGPVTLNVPEVGSFNIKLPENRQAGMAIRMPGVLPNQGNLIARIRVES